MHNIKYNQTLSSLFLLLILSAGTVLAFHKDTENMLEEEVYKNNITDSDILAIKSININEYSENYQQYASHTIYSRIMFYVPEEQHNVNTSEAAAFYMGVWHDKCVGFLK